MLKARRSLLLLVGALLGLLGQGIAYAAGPSLSPKMAMSHVTPSRMDCAGMATPDPSSEHPCKGLTLACIAQMGCVVPMTFEEPARVLKRSIASQIVIWPASRALAGLNVAPEPEPPTV